MIHQGQRALYLPIRRIVSPQICQQSTRLTVAGVSAFSIAHIGLLQIALSCADLHVCLGKFKRKSRIVPATLH